MENFNFVNLYFAICLIAWIIDLIASVAIYFIKPLRKWFIKVYWKLVMSFINFGNEFLELFPEDKKEEKNEKDENL